MKRADRHARGRRACLRLLLAGGLATITTAAAPADEPIIVGRKDTTTQLLLAELTAQLLEAKGRTVTRAEPMGSAIIRKAQETDRVDIYWESPNTALLVSHRFQEPLQPPDALAQVRELDMPKGLVWFAPSRIRTRLVLAMRAVDSRDMGIQSLSDLAVASNAGAELMLASPVEFAMRADGLRPLEKRYGFKFGAGKVHSVPLVETVGSLISETVDIAVVSDLDPRVSRNGLAVLRDDLDVFPMLTLAPVARREALENHVGLDRDLAALLRALSTQTIGELKAEILLEGKPVEEVAAAFLTRAGLI